MKENINKIDNNEELKENNKENKEKGDEIV